MNPRKSGSLKTFERDSNVREPEEVYSPTDSTDGWKAASELSGWRDHGHKPVPLPDLPSCKRAPVARFQKRLIVAHGIDQDDLRNQRVALEEAETINLR